MKSISLSILFVLACLFLKAPAVHATPVTLTGGTVSVVANVGTISVTGNNFTLSYLGDTQGSSNSFFINTVTLSLGSPNVMFQGVSSAIFRGSISFNNSNVTGSIVAFSTMQDLFFNQNPLFSVEFTGAGSMVITNLGGPTQTQFNVTSVPEPATIVPLFVGLLSSGGLLARRYRQRSSIIRPNQTE